jgi:hypothetical protein
MEFIVTVSAAERAQSALSPGTESAALASLNKNGCALLRGAFERAHIEELSREFDLRYGTLGAPQMKALADAPPPNRFLEVGGGRFEITIAMDGPFGRPQLFANLMLCRFLSGRIGGDMRLSSFTTVVSHPGSALQHIHRDAPFLFPSEDPARPMPIYAINCAVPLIDVDMQTGPTAIWLGSHRWPGDVVPPVQEAACVPFERGDCLLVDYRTLHTGIPNNGTRARPILYMAYARTWFFDETNHIGRLPLDMTLDSILGLPEYTRPLMTRAYSQAVRARWEQVRK